MTVREVRRRLWDYILYESPTGFLLSVVCGSVGLYVVTIALSGAEGNRCRHDDRYLDGLVAKVRDFPHEYRERRVPSPAL
ncbi:MAG TPA: hypothetical protein VFV67_31475 [Actinophytocola sp.]|uniref:hypothetical protein n=1 Tax=Actinophytocola sp. TaxID=1872138 RepID=UPI002DB5B730|nr:hypothetical protein [Actinophytocola sp.]HEU5475187.1 hypothetical protein [Actinophytocola sp.]